MREPIEIEAKLEAASRFPWGKARAACIAEAVTWADEAENVSLQLRARFELINCYMRSGQDQKIIAPFVWLLNFTQTRPDDADADTHEMVRWFFKSTINTLANNPLISLSQIEQLLEQMRQYYLADGASLQAYYAVCAHVSSICGKPEQTEEFLAKWRAANRDENSNCVACDPLVEIDYFNCSQQWDKVIGSGLSTIADNDSCEAQPARTQSQLLEALSRTGRSASAWECHLSAWRAMRDNIDEIASLGSHLSYLGRLEMPARALRCIRQSLPMLSEVSSHLDAMWYTAGLAVALQSLTQCGKAKEPVGVRASAVPEIDFAGIEAGDTVEVAAKVARDCALTLAQRFDQRNGNRVISELIETELNAPHYPHAGKLNKQAFNFIEAETNPLPKLEGAAQLLSASLPEPEVAPDYPLPTWRDDEIPADLDIFQLLAFFRQHLKTHVHPRYSTFYQKIYDRLAVLLPVDESQIEDPEELMILATLNSRLFQKDEAQELLEKAIKNATDDLLRLQAKVKCLQVGLENEAVSKSAVMKWIEGNQGTVLEAGNLLPDLPADNATGDVRDFIELQVDDRFWLISEYQTLSCSVNLYEQAEQALAVMEKISSRFPVLQPTYQLELAQYYLSRGQAYEGAITADKAMRMEALDNLRHQIVGRSILTKASMDVKADREAAAQLRESLTLCVNAGLLCLQGVIASQLGTHLFRNDRYLEAAEVLEEVLQQVGHLDKLHLVVILRQLLVKCLKELDEDARVVEEARLTCATMLSLGQYDAALDMLHTAFESLRFLDRFDEAVDVLRQREQIMLDHMPDSQSRTLSLSRSQRMRARTLVSRITPRVAAEYLDEALAILDEADVLIRQLTDEAHFSVDYELGDSMDDRAYVLWRCDHNAEAAELFKSAAEKYLQRDREAAAHALVRAANIYARELNDAAETRACIARIEEVLAHPRWQAHKIWQVVRELKESLGDL